MANVTNEQDRFAQLRKQLPSMNLLVLQGSPFCNIDCDYCYLPNRQETRRMTYDVLEKTMTRVFESGLVNGPFTILWHAGEPLAVPKNYYEKCIEVIYRFPQARQNANFLFQTNAMLINQEWCDFFKAHPIEIGVSLDGPEFLHDKHRVTRSGKGTHAKAMNGVRLLQENGIEFAVIAVVTQDSLDHPDEMYEFFTSLNSIGVGFNIEEIEGANNVSSLSGEEAELRVRQFFYRMYELNRQNGYKLKIREFEGARERVMQPDVYVNLEPAPFAMLNVDCDGNFSTFSPELLGQATEKYGSFSFGNVLENKILDAFENESFLQIVDDIQEGNRKCSETCSYYKSCQGASPSNKYYENGTFASSETMNCRHIIQTPMDIVREDIYRSGHWSLASEEELSR